MSGNREYKSDVFSMLLREPENALEVYNALNHTHYDNPEDVEIQTLERGVSLTVRNDAAFVIDWNLNIYEHQSTYNPNMPLRSLIYFVNVIEPIAKSRDLYSRKLIRIPTPHFVVFYNGAETRPEVEELYLSSAFEQQTQSPELELKCTVYNLNRGNNQSLLAQSRVLREYMYFIDMIRSHVAEKMELEDAIVCSIDTCIREHVMEEFLRKNREEVLKVTTIDCTWERREELIKQEYYEDGLAQGRSQGVYAMVHTLAPYLSTPEAIHAAITQNPGYEDVTLEEIQTILANSR